METDGSATACSSRLSPDSFGMPPAASISSTKAHRLTEDHCCVLKTEEISLGAASPQQKVSEVSSENFFAESDGGGGVYPSRSTAWAGKVAPWVKVLAARPDDLSSVTGCPLTSTHKPCLTHTHTHTNTYM